MFLKKAEGSYFRNYKEFSLEFTSLISIFTGDNGQGKSSFLEVLYCCLRGRSFYPFISSIYSKWGKRANVCLTLEEERGLSTLSADFFSREYSKKEIFLLWKKNRAIFSFKKISKFCFYRRQYEMHSPGF